jgi:hypothetical protein
VANLCHAFLDEPTWHVEEVRETMSIATLDHKTHVARAPYLLSIEMAGLLTLMLGAWSGVVPYVGPIFGFSGDGAGSWTWNLAHALLFLVPGAAACIAAAIIMIEGLSTGPARRGLLALGGLLALVCGTWLVIGPIAWPALQGTAFFAGASPLHEFAYWVGYALGPGALLVALGAFVLGRPRQIGGASEL